MTVSAVYKYIVKLKFFRYPYGGENIVRPVTVKMRLDFASENREQSLRLHVKLRHILLASHCTLDRFTVFLRLYKCFSYYACHCHSGVGGVLFVRIGEFRVFTH